MLYIILALGIIINPQIMHIDKRIIYIDKMISYKNWSLAQNTTLKLARAELLKQRDEIMKS